MRRLRVSARAESDLRAIRSYIAEFSETSADGVVRRITAQFASLRVWPHLGRDREDLRPGVRSHPMDTFLIFYTVSADEVRILRIIDGRRNLRAIFRVRRRR